MEVSLEPLEEAVLEQAQVLAVTLQKQTALGAKACLARVVLQQEGAMAFLAKEVEVWQEHFAICSFSSGASAHL
jgi:hypothetical protein